MLIVLPSMIVDDLDFPGFAITPNETDPPLIVDANTDLTLTVLQCVH